MGSPDFFILSCVVTFVSVTSAWLIVNMFMIKRCRTLAFLFLWLIAWPVTWIVIPVWVWRYIRFKRNLKKAAN